MKNYKWLAALLAVFVLLFIGCPTEPDDGPEGPPETPPDTPTLAGLFSATPTTQEKANVTLNGNTVTFTFTGGELWGELVAPEDSSVDASDKTGIRFEYKATANVGIFLQDTNTLYIYAPTGTNGWGAVASAEDWTELTLPFANVQGPDDDGQSVWWGENIPFNKGAIIKLVFQIADGAQNKRFELRNFAFY
jgi:hypothetical protein